MKPKYQKKQTKTVDIVPEIVEVLERGGDESEIFAIMDKYRLPVEETKAAYENALMVLEYPKMEDSSLSDYCKDYLKIRDKNGNIIPFAPNEHQENLFNIVGEWKQQYPDETCRPSLFIIILKARQIGFSTSTEALFYHEVTLNKNKIAMVISYDNDSATHINDMSDRFYQFFPKHLRPMRRSAKGKGILFENPTNDMNEFEENPGMQSKFLIETSGNIYAGSSFTINYLHISEIAKWPKAKDTMTSLLQAVPQFNSIVVIESTANGIEYFHELWKKSEQKRINYKMIFVPWFKHKEYVRPFDTNDEKNNLAKTLDEEELQLIKLFNVTYEQLNWRRWCISEKCNDSLDEFHQEYPSTPDEAFLTSGKPVFNRMKIQERINYLENLYREKPLDKGYVEYDEDSETFNFVPDTNGTFFVYSHPKPNYPYVLGVDVAEGIVNGNWSVVQVCDNTTGEQVAKLRLHILPDAFATEIVKVARYYNDALVAVELNNHGRTTRDTLVNIHNYHKQYMRETVDDITKQRKREYGFLTTPATRPQLVDKARAIVRDNPELVNDLDTLYEMLTFIFDDTGKPTAEEDCEDDCVLSFCIMHMARSQARAYMPVEKVDTSQGKHWSVIQDELKQKKIKAKTERLIKKPFFNGVSYERRIKL